jgi:hypothetical protein
MKVEAADGSTWRVRRRWLPWRRRVRDVPDAPLDIGTLARRVDDIATALRLGHRLPRRGVAP